MAASGSAQRYAIYFVPGANTALYRFGASTLGYDGYTGQDMALIDGVDPKHWLNLVREPRSYGFHATLKAPFRLATGMSESDLERDLLNFAADRPAVLVGDMVVEELGSFVGLVPKAPSPMLDELAHACVRRFDRFRAALTEGDRERRLRAGLTERQKAYLERWGYPYIFDDFRFHMSLTGSLPPSARERALRQLRDKFARIQHAAPVILDRLIIARQLGNAPFQVINQAFLGQSPCRPYAYTC